VGLAVPLGRNRRAAVNALVVVLIALVGAAVAFFVGDRLSTRRRNWSRRRQTIVASSFVPMLCLVAGTIGALLVPDHDGGWRDLAQASVVAVAAIAALITFVAGIATLLLTNWPGR
jgi:quinol-cytochrome oxidoreductase complex cytochrome b subunit